ALGTAERDRRDLALLRARGASRRSLLFLAAVESAALGLLAGAIGTGAALLAIRLVGSGGAIGTTRVLVAFAVCVALGFAGALARRSAAARASARALPRLARRAGRRRSRQHLARLSAGERGPPRRGDQPRPTCGRTAARLRRQRRALRRHLRPAGPRRRAAD